MSDVKQKLLLVGNAYWVETNRQKASELSRWFDVICVTHSAEGHKLMGKTLNAEAAQPAENNDYDLHLLPIKGNTQGGTKFTLVGLEDVIKSSQPDIILIETEPWARLFWQVVIAKYRFCKTAKVGLFSWENIRRPGLKGLILDQVYRFAGKCLSFVIAGNRDAQSLFEAGGVKKSLIHVDAQLGFDVTLLPKDSAAERLENRRLWCSKDDTIIIGYCGRYVAEKGVWNILDAVKKIRSQRAVDLPDIELHFLGGGPLEPELKAIAKEEPWFKLHGFVPHKEVLRVMNAWDVFVLASKRLEEDGKLWEEQFGHVLLNAMGAGCVTLGSTSGAIPEVLADDSSVLFPPSDPDALADMLNGYINSSEKCQLTREWQERRAHEYYSFAQITERYVAHMKQCNLML